MRNKMAKMAKTRGAITPERRISMELTQRELLQRLHDMVHELADNVLCRAESRTVLINEIAKLNELALRISRYGVQR